MVKFEVGRKRGREGSQDRASEREGGRDSLPKTTEPTMLIPTS